MRLIDADKFKGKAICNHTYGGVLKIINIDDIPTAYDIDKVVEELEKSSKWVNETNEYGDNDGNDYISLSKTIEIVKQGGVGTNDVCKWKLTDTKKLMPYKTSCGNEDLYDSHYKYCPFCGKKILYKE